MSILKVTIKNGTAKVEVDGIAGQSCKGLTGNIEKALGVSQNPEYKPEYYQEEGQQQCQ